MSAQVRAQKAANQSNEKIAAQTNDLQRELAQQANDLNYRMFQEQNQWNLDQWNRENEYNSPSAQVQRYIEAGINPIWAIAGGNPGNASQVGSAQWSGAEMADLERPTIMPEDPTGTINQILQASQNFTALGQGFADLALKQEDVSTRRSAQISRSALDFAAAAHQRGAAVGQELENKWSLQTFDVRSRQETQKLFNLESQQRNLDTSTEEHKAKTAQIDALKSLINEQTMSVIEGIKQRDRELDIMSRNASANELNAKSRQGELSLADERFAAEIKKWNNDALMQYLYKFGRTVKVGMSAKVGLEGLAVSGSGGMQETTPADIQKLKACGIEIITRYGENPTPDSQKQAEEAASLIQAIQDIQQSRFVQPVDALFNSSTSPVLNTSEY